ncbi:hypothetical protein HDE_13097 [Halotydeus destructor]|nr:hypothetical protein HDE_13097 [Halotydeus destructor]
MKQLVQLLQLVSAIAISLLINAVSCQTAVTMDPEREKVAMIVFASVLGVFGLAVLAYLGWLVGAYLVRRHRDRNSSHVVAYRGFDGERIEQSQMVTPTGRYREATKYGDKKEEVNHEFLTTPATREQGFHIMPHTRENIDRTQSDPTAERPKNPDPMDMDAVSMPGN